MRRLLVILFTPLIQISSAQNGANSDTSKIEASKIEAKTICGEYVHQTSHGYTVLKIKRSKHFQERGLLYLGWTIRYGEWKIQNDTLILAEKYFKDKPSGKKTKSDRTIHFIMHKGSLFRLDKDNGTEMKGKYIPKSQWEKSP